jgi:predicted lipoprotein
MHLTLAALAILIAAPAVAAPDQAALARRAVSQVILPGYQRLAEATETLAAEADGACSGEGSIEAGPVKDAWNGAFDAWIAVEAFRFGPADAAGIAGWPDSEAATPKALDALAASEDAVVDDRAAFAATPAADRGLFAAEYLLFGPGGSKIEGDAYSCRLLMAVSRNLSDTAAAISSGWRDHWSQALLDAGAPGNADWKSPEAATASLYAALADGLAADADLRLGRPLASDDPHVAEAWRSGRSLRNVEVSLAALRAYAASVFGPALPPEAAARVDTAFAAAIAETDHVGAPLETAVASDAGRSAVTALEARVRDVEAAVATAIAPVFGIAAGAR